MLQKPPSPPNPEATAKTAAAAPSHPPSPLLTRSFLILCVAQFAFFSSDRMLWVVLPLYLKELGMGYTAIGVILGVFTVSSTACRPLVGRAVDRQGEQAFLFFGTLIFTFAPLGYLLTTSVPGLFALRLLHGVGPALFVTACYTQISRLSPPQRLAEALTYITMANNLAMAVGPAVGVYVAQKWGFPLLCVVAASMAACALLAGLGPSSDRQSVHAPPEAASRPAPQATQGLGRRITRPAVVIFLALMSFGSVMSFFPLFAAAHGVDNPGVFFTVMAITLLLVRAAGGRIADMYSRAQIIVPSLGLMAAGMFLLALATSELMFNLAAVLCGSGVSLLVPTLMASVIEQAGAANRGWAVGIFTAVMDLSMASGTVLSGIILNLTSAYPLVFAASGGCILLSLLIFVLHTLPEPNGSQAAG